MQGDPDGKSIQVPFSDDKADAPANDNALLDEESKPGETFEERKSRSERRKERLSTIIAEGRKSTERVKELEERDSKRERELAELRGELGALRQQRQAPPSPADGKDDFDRRLDSVYDKQTNTYAAAQAEIKAGTWTEDRQRYYERIARDIETEKSQIHAEKVLASREPARRQEQAQQVWVQKYPEVYQNPRAYQYAEATFKRRLSMLGPGEQATNEMVDEAMGEAMTQFKLGSRRAPTASEKSRLAGIPSSGAGGGGRSDPPGITMTPELRRMALAAYDHLPEAEALKAWANKTGKRMRDKKAI